MNNKGTVSSLETKLRIVVEENEKVNILLSEKLREVDQIKMQLN